MGFIEDLQEACGYNEDEDCGVDALIYYKNALEDYVYSAEAERYLAAWFTPDAIRDTADPDLETYGDESEIAAWIKAANDEQLREIGEECINSDVLWRTFHELIEEAIRTRL